MLPSQQAAIVQFACIHESTLYLLDRSSTAGSRDDYLYTADRRRPYDELVDHLKAQRFYGQSAKLSVNRVRMNLYLIQNASQRKQGLVQSVHPGNAWLLDMDYRHRVGCPESCSPPRRMTLSPSVTIFGNSNHWSEVETVSRPRRYWPAFQRDTLLPNQNLRKRPM